MLRLEWSYSDNLHRRETIERVAQDFLASLRSLIAHCRSMKAGSYKALDFAEFGWDEQYLEEINDLQ
jgi:hypothetical protein